ncbi:MAG: Cadherin protein, partial [Verrucomicrobiaceae bacterium]|nr:Cadherin protein [Verrucomicrobiaceae bacterium]
TPVYNTKWKTLSFVPTTGTFTGSFELVDGTLKRPVAFSGVLRQPASNADPLIGDGHYLLPPMTGTEKTTGEIMFTRP